MPTTLLFGETCDQAYRRRFEEEAEIDRKIELELASKAETTSCWNCSTAYQITRPMCPSCGAANANVDFDAAMSECAGSYE